MAQPRSGGRAPLPGAGGRDDLAGARTAADAGRNPFDEVRNLLDEARTAPEEARLRPVPVGESPGLDATDLASISPAPSLEGDRDQPTKAPDDAAPATLAPVPPISPGPAQPLPAPPPTPAGSLDEAPAAAAPVPSAATTVVAAGPVQPPAPERAAAARAATPAAAPGPGGRWSASGLFEIGSSVDQPGPDVSPPGLEVPVAGAIPDAPRTTPAPLPRGGAPPGPPPANDRLEGPLGPLLPAEDSLADRQTLQPASAAAPPAAGPSTPPAGGASAPMMAVQVMRSAVLPPAGTEPARSRAGPEPAADPVATSPTPTPTAIPGAVAPEPGSRASGPPLTTAAVATMPEPTAERRGAPAEAGAARPSAGAEAPSAPPAAPADPPLAPAPSGVATAPGLLGRAAPAHPLARPAAVADVRLAAVPLELGLKSLAGVSRFAMRLDPPELGRVDVRLDIDEEGGIKARLVVERADTLLLLQRDAPALRLALEQAGFKPAEGGLDLILSNGTGEGFPGGADGREPQPHPGARFPWADKELPREAPVPPGTPPSPRSSGIDRTV